MAVEHFFCGSAIGRVSPEGRVMLPSFVRAPIERRSRGRTLLFGAHEKHPCLTGCDVSYAPLLLADIERRRLRDEAEGVAPADHYARLRRAFGFAEEAAFAEDGRILLPPIIRLRGRIGDMVLFVGAGFNFEVWNPGLAREAGSDELRELADYRLGNSRNHEKEEES